ncbi:MAG: uracil-DNA glycosylase [Actinomycetota bacterium]|nr:uracil-DNA glycosylase [Actinomycetota bacterium]MDK1016255.1 uracil-DNA glycosylase [Actinomycetota bacterium]MDK1026011.1 uracil-DNA glycosylase [Actinomycetota bacterium]MDK1037877.1 uracil-DNA glycosylase [Actinomycetota bacterium]MDK1096894.1 uracil-DNA glycosylase [Actinomycetota bacterium]
MRGHLETIETLDELASIAHGCTECSLAESRTNVVFGSGSPTTDVMIVGEAPGQQEDVEGLPFVGRSGRLLDKLLGEVDLDRGDVYIANVVKCRPPSNRDPRPDEIDSCKGYLRRQIELIDPKVVLTLGNFSMKLLLNTTTGITRMRGTAYEWWGRFLVPTFHPAAALRGGDRVTNDIRADLSLVRNIIDGNVVYTDER